MGNFSNLIPTSLGETISVAVIEDQKPQNTNGGTFTSGAWRTRDLNTVTSDDDSIVTLNANQFTLQAGTYLIEAFATSYRVARSVAKLYNVTDVTDEIIGLATFANNASGNTVISHIEGSIVLSAPKTFEIQHECQTTQTSDGFGIGSNFGVEVYSQVKITKFG